MKWSSTPQAKAWSGASASVSTRRERSAGPERLAAPAAPPVPKVLKGWTAGMSLTNVCSPRRTMLRTAPSLSIDIKTLLPGSPASCPVKWERAAGRVCVVPLPVCTTISGAMAPAAVRRSSALTTSAPPVPSGRPSTCSNSPGATDRADRRSALGAEGDGNAKTVCASTGLSNANPSTKAAKGLRTWVKFIFSVSVRPSETQNVTRKKNFVYIFFNMCLVPAGHWQCKYSRNPCSRENLRCAARATAVNGTPRRNLA